jgi:hypothetical protein
LIHKGDDLWVLPRFLVVNPFDPAFQPFRPSRQFSRMPVSARDAEFRI